MLKSYFEKLTKYNNVSADLQIDTKDVTKNHEEFNSERQQRIRINLDILKKCNAVEQELERGKVESEENVARALAIQPSIKSSDVKELSMKELELVRQVETQENKLIKKKRIINKLRAKLETYQNKKDVILAYKLLTNTHFEYRSSEREGFIYNEETNRYRTFKFNPKKLTPEQISEKVWKLLDAFVAEENKCILEKKDPINSSP